MWLIIGLGNPGREYRETRHNMGFLTADRFASRHGIKVWRFGFRSRYGRGKIRGLEIVLLKPRTFMNLSGDAVHAAMKNFRLKPDDLIVIHDDLDLPLGRVKIAKKGSDGGHKGIRSIIGSIGTQAFTRVRLGIGKPEDKDEDIVDWVLTGFKPEEIAARDEAIETAAEAVLTIMDSGVDAAMNKFNTVK